MSFILLIVVLLNPTQLAAYVARIAYFLNMQPELYRISTRIIQSSLLSRINNITLHFF